MIKINNLIPTHNTIRDPKSVRLIVDFLREGRIFRCQDLLNDDELNILHYIYHVSFKPICLTKFSDDDKLYIRDGHRRLCAAVLAGANSLLDCEYTIEEMSYKDYMTANPEKGWYTPFDPRVECRLPDFFAYKDRMLSIYPSAKAGNEYRDLLQMIYYSKNEYLEPRKVNSLEELVRINFPNGCN